MSRRQTLKPNTDGSLTIYVQASPLPEAQRSYRLPARQVGDFSLCVRATGPGWQSRTAHGHRPQGNASRRNRDLDVCNWRIAPFFRDALFVCGWG